MGMNPRAGRIKRILHFIWLSERAGWVHLARLGFPALVTQEKVVFLAIELNTLLTKLVRLKWRKIGPGTCLRFC